MMKNMLIVDDHQQIINVLKRYALQEGFEVFTAENGFDALQLFEQQHFDILLLDIMLPGIDGLAVCREIRSQSLVPIILITAKNEDYERIMGLDSGADDYITKPFSPKEVMARVRAILRRVEHTKENQDSLAKVGYDNLMIHLEKKKVTIDGHPIRLTRRELELLWLLVTNKDKVFSRDNLLDSLWGIEYFGDVRTVDTHIRRLRAKLAQIPHPNWDIATVWGQGYRFEVQP